jgi:hypothetical protein
MRSSRRLRPVFDCLHVRIAPSALSVIPPAVVGSAAVAVAMDDTGSPGGEPTGEGCFPIIMTPPGGGSTTGSIC